MRTAAEAAESDSEQGAADQAEDAEYLFIALLAILFLARGKWASQDVAPVLSLGVLYLLGVLFVSARWGLVLGLATGVVSALAFNFFHRRLLRA